ncbi:MAG: hypothetical protein INR71_06215, partial [Terriglobus roseus]|nr:hypothetical protein [Terriglobus roseus]
MRRALQSSRLQAEDAGAATQDAAQKDESGSYERELEWLVVSKATTQIYGQLLSLILEQTIPLSHDIEYWDTILDSYRYTALYSVQTSPLRLYTFSQEVYKDVRARGGASAEEGWRQFYTLVKQVVRDRNLADVRQRVVSPIARVRAECRKKRDGLRKMRYTNANALGVLLGEGLSNQSIHDKGLATPTEVESLDGHRDRWKSTILKSIALMDAVLKSIDDADVTVDTFDGAVGAATEDDQFFQLGTEQGAGAASAELGPSEAVGRLQSLLSTRLPAYQAAFSGEVREHGRPSALIRWWLPAAALFLSSSTLLRVLVNRKAEVVDWIREFGVTVRDFWANWVVEPT